MDKLAIAVGSNCAMLMLDMDAIPAVLIDCNCDGLNLFNCKGVMAKTCADPRVWIWLEPKAAMESVVSLEILVAVNAENCAGLKELT